MIRNTVLTLIGGICLAVLLIPTAIFADAPPYVEFQGRLTDAANIPLQGSYSVTFAIYNSSSGPTELWSQVHSVTTDANGMFDVILGAIPDSVWDEPNRWLGITVPPDAEMTPRTQFYSSPYSFRVESVEDANGGRITGDVVVAGDSIAIRGEVTASANSTRGVFGYTSNSTGEGIGVRGQSNGGPTPVGVSGYAQDGSAETRGVEGFAGGAGDEHVGVYGLGSNAAVMNIGVEGEALNSGNYNYGMYAHGRGGGSTNYGIYAQGDGASTNYGIYAFSPSGTNNWAGYFDGDVHITGSLTGGGVSASGWADDGTIVRLESINDSVGIGTTTPAAKLDVQATTTGKAVQGIVSGSNTGTGGYFEGGQKGVSGFVRSGSGYNYGVYGQSNGSTDLTGFGVYGITTAGYIAVGVRGKGYGGTHMNVGVQALSDVGPTNAPEHLGLYAEATGATTTNYGIQSKATGSATTNYGIYAEATGATTNYAGYFVGDVYVSGTLTGGSKAFRIDHPLDPDNKYLYHSCVESPDMMNVYNGNVTTDANGFATVVLPDYFQALNRDFRYQLTVIGTFAQAIVADEITNGSFVIQTDKPDVKVSWQVTGIRQDKWAVSHPVKVEVDKHRAEKTDLVPGNSSR